MSSLRLCPSGARVLPVVRWKATTWQRAVAHGYATRRIRCGKKGTIMGLGDKISNAAEEAKGKVKEATGKATDNRSLEAEGKGDQASANVKQAGENAKDAVKDALN